MGEPTAWDVSTAVLVAAAALPLLTAGAGLLLVILRRRLGPAVSLAYVPGTLLLGRLLISIATETPEGEPPAGGDLILGGLSMIVHLGLLVAVVFAFVVWMTIRTFGPRSKPPAFRATLLP